MNPNALQATDNTQTTLLNAFDTWCEERNSIAMATHQLAHCAFAEFQLLTGWRDNPHIPTPTREAFNQASERLACSLNALFQRNPEFNPQGVALALKEHDMNVQANAYRVIGAAISLNGHNKQALELAESVLAQCGGAIPVVTEENIATYLESPHIQRMLLTEMTGADEHSMASEANTTALVKSLHRAWSSEGSIAVGNLPVAQMNALATDPMAAEEHYAMSQCLP